MAKVWDNPQVLVDLVVGLYEVAEGAKLLNPQTQAAVQQHMAKNGHTVTWSAIRQHVQKLRKTRDAAGIRGNAGGASNGTSKADSNKTPSKSPGKRARGKVIEPSLAMAPKEDEDDDIQFRDVKKEEEDEDSVPSTPAKRPSKKLKKSASAEPDHDIEA